MKSITQLLLIVFYVSFSPYAFADVHQAITNAQAGLDDALRTSFPLEKKYVRIEKRDDGILVFKVSMRRVDEQTVRFRITGYDGSDEVCIVTYQIIHDNSYKTIQEYKRLKQSMSNKSEKKGTNDDRTPAH